MVGLGLLLGCALAALAAVKVPSMERRGTETWAVKSDIFVTQSGFPWGRVTLPSQEQTEVIPGGSSAPKGNSQQQFADPGRFSNLALLYSVIAYSDQVREKLPGRPDASQIQAIPLDATGNGTVFLPIIRITTQADTPGGAKRLNEATVDGLRGLLETEQRGAKIPNNERVRLNTLNNPGAPELMQGRSLTPSILAMLLCVLGAVALAHILEALRPRPEWQEQVVAPPVAGLRSAPASVSAVAPPPPPSTSNWASSSPRVAPAVEGEAEVQAEPAPSRRRGIFR